MSATPKTKRRWLLGAVAAATLPLMAAATAWACTSIATLKFSDNAVRPGQEVTVRGENFNAGAEVGKVQIRFGSLVGPVLASAEPNDLGEITTTVTVPDDVPFGGQYVIVATQEGKKGKPAFGTPARAPLSVAAPAGESAPPNTSAAPQEQSVLAAEEQSTGVGTWIALGALGLLALALLGGGLGLFLRELRSPTTAPAGQEPS